MMELVAAAWAATRPSPSLKSRYMQKLAPLKKPDLLSTPVATLLRDAILDWELPPGERIIERQLATQWNISRAPLREAIKELMAEGLVEVSPRRGASVRDISISELRELFAVREMIEAYAIRVAIRLADESAIARMERLVNGMQIAADARDFEQFCATGLGFHDELVLAAQNHTLAALYDRVKLKFRRYQVVLASLPELPSSSVEEHRKILAAIKLRDEDRASAEVVAHLEHLVTRFTASSADIFSRFGRPSTIRRSTHARRPK
jgi:DNA-binding GntR family transcriptional regulator